MRRHNSSSGEEGWLFSYVDAESRIPPKHPLRAIRPIVSEVLPILNTDFAGLGIDERVRSP